MDRTEIELERQLNTVRYVDLYNAMSNDSYSLSRLSAEEYVIVREEFKKRLKIKQTSIEKQLRPIEIDIMLLTNCLIYFPVLGADIESCKILESLGVKIVDNLQGIINNIQIELNKLVSKTNMLKSTMPDLSKVIRLTGLEMVADLSLATELKLDNNISVLEYISYHNAANKKSANLKKQYNK